MVVILMEPDSVFTMVDSTEVAVLLGLEDIQPTVSMSSMILSLMAPNMRMALAPKAMFPASMDKAKSLDISSKPPCTGAPAMVRVAALSTDTAEVSVIVGALKRMLSI